MGHQLEHDDFIHMSLFPQADTAAIAGIDVRRLRVWHQRDHFKTQYKPEGRGDARLYTCSEVLGLAIMRDLVDGAGIDVALAGSISKLAGLLMFQVGLLGWVAIRFDDKKSATKISDNWTLDQIQSRLGTNAFATVNLGKYEAQKETIATLAGGLSLIQSMKDKR